MRSVAVITMVHNESFFLPKWINYYGKNFSRQCLYVVDHGTEDGSTDDLADINLMRLPRTDFDDEQRVKFICKLAEALLAYYDVVIYTDCDEFLVPDPDHFVDLADYCNKMEQNTVYAVGVDVRQLLDIESSIDPNLSILGQRRFCRFKLSMCKPLITRVPIHWNPGFHTCNSKPGLDSRLIMFHMKYIDLDMSINRLSYTRNMAWSEKAIKKNQGSHQRRSDQELIKNFTVDKKSFKSGPKPFEFSQEVDEIENSAYSNSKGMYIKNIQDSNKYMEIPNRFFGIV